MFSSVNKNVSVVLGLLLTLVLASACNLTDSDKENISDGFNPPPVEDPVDDWVSTCEYERFIQPEAEVVKKIDILFMVDTSGSLNVERTSIANGLDAFVQELPGDVDYRVGVMYAHGEASNGSGRLRGVPRVLDSATMSLDDIRTKLIDRMNNPQIENSTDGGEVGMYALQRALTTELDYNRSEGFFRDDAALAVIFIADENDICSLGNYPQGITPVPDPNNKEIPSFQLYCDDVSPQSVVNQVKALKPDMPYLISGVIYNGDSPVPAGDENEIGYGYLETINMANGIVIDLASGNYDFGMQQIGFLAYKRLKLQTEFNLSRNDFVEDTLEVFVDDSPISFVYQSEVNQIQISESDAGGEKSEVIVQYCLPAAPAPIISNFRIFRITFTTADLEWNTDQAATSRVTITHVGSGAQTTYDNSDFQAFHQMRMTGLIPNSAYEIVVEVANAEGTTASKTTQFSTLDDSILAF